MCGPPRAGAVAGDGRQGLSVRSAVVVVAGDFSKRFGDREKALAMVAGEGMIARIVYAISSEAGEVVVNCRPGEAVRVPEREFRGWTDPDRLRAVDTPAELARVRRRFGARRAP